MLTLKLIANASQGITEFPELPSAYCYYGKNRLFHSLGHEVDVFGMEPYNSHLSS